MFEKKNEIKALASSCGGRSVWDVRCNCEISGVLTK